jgi:hypothetical protein
VRYGLLFGALLAAIAASLAPAQANSQAEGQATSAASSQATSAEPSLADVARKVRAERAKSGSKPVKVYTNADLPAGPGGLSIVGSEAPRGRPSGEAAPSERGHGEAYYARAMNKLQSRLEIDQRELAVLEQKLSLSGPQYYPDPNRALQEQYSRASINKLTGEIEAKKRQISDGEKAIRDLREQLAREGGDPGWLRAGALAAARDGSEPEEQAPSALPPGSKLGTREYWQAKFKAARARLKAAEEEQQLAEDELSLLKTRQAAELSEESQRQLAAEVPAKQAEVETKQASTARARQALDALEQAFKESGAPEEWIKEPE